MHADRRHAHDDYVGPGDVNRLSVRSAVARVETPVALSSMALRMDACLSSDEK